MEDQTGKKAGRAGVFKQIAPIFLLLMLLAAVVAVSGGTGTPSAIRPLQVHLAAQPYAYCTFPLLEDSSSRYDVTIEVRDAALVDALKNGIPDAAIVSAQYLSQIDQDAYTAVAVTSFLNLAAVQNGGAAASLYDLNGKEVILPDTVRQTLEFKMLAALLAKTNVAPILLFEKEDALARRVQTGDFEFMILPADKCAAVLLCNDKYRSCFDLSGQWAALMGTMPPAGSCLVIRKALLAQGSEHVLPLRKDMQTGIDYANAKHKKAAQLIVSLGLGTDAVYIMKTLPHCAFSYLEGAAKEEALKQLSALSGGE